MDIYGIIPITPYKVRYWINADLTTSLLTFPFTLAAIFMSQITPDICLHPLNGAKYGGLFQKRSTGCPPGLFLT